MGPLAPESPEPAAPERSGVLLAEIEWWEPPVAMEVVLARIDPANNARADFDFGVVGITPDEFDAAVAAASER